MAKKITMASDGSTTRGSSRVALAAALTLPVGLAAAFAPLAAQDINLLFAADSIESLLRAPELRIIGSAGTRFEGDRTQRVVLEFEDDLRIKVKWAKAPSGGRGSFNNRPRYEIAAYELQKLFLDDPEYVVPPTIARCVPVDQQRQIEGTGLSQQALAPSPIKPTQLVSDYGQLHWSFSYYEPNAVDRDTRVDVRKL